MLRIEFVCFVSSQIYPESTMQCYDPTILFQLIFLHFLKRVKLCRLEVPDQINMGT